ncbi:heavy metal-binding protein HIP-like [Mercenaria mercenaria]|uniref:heavy metal-binding protein HIP-like n=1 Tax=Mercenaria mercenaria TaxID=6596 RepID=UPI00234EFE7F|nr:heavy metal-binding protein HIP-like [Mercenaria mercenaria]
MTKIILSVLCLAVVQTSIRGSQKHTRMLLEEYSLEDIVNKLNNLTSRVEKCEAVIKHGPVAFKAHLTKSVSPGANERIFFDDVRLNLGGAYHAHLGGFVTPYNGTYLFSVSVCSTSGHYIVLDLMRNSDVIGRILAGDTQYDDCSSETTVAELRAGDDVFVQHHLNTGDYIHYQQHTVNSFTGTLLQTM